MKCSRIRSPLITRFFCGDATAIYRSGTIRVYPTERPSYDEDDVVGLMGRATARSLLRRVKRFPGRIYIEATIKPMRECFPEPNQSRAEEETPICVPFTRPIILEVRRLRVDE